MEAMRESWTDKRLDERFDGIDRRLDALERRMDQGFKELRTELGGLQRTMLQTSGVTIAALIGLIATQL
jgi:hypothetical protein